MRGTKISMAKRRKDALEGSGVEAKDLSETNKNSPLNFLIDYVTTSPANELDVGPLKQIKQIVRLSDANVRAAFDLLMEKLKKNHSQVRYRALLVVDELFTRSKLFRSLLVHDFEAFMLHSIGFRAESPLPPPANRATLLREKGMEFLEKWNDMFGPHYKHLRLGYEYLKNNLNLRFPNLRQAAVQAELQRKEREARSMALIQKKYDTLKDDFSVLSAEIESTLDQLDECFEILSCNNKQGSTSQTGGSDKGISAAEGDVDNNDFKSKSARSLRHILQQASSQQVELCETQDNKPVFDTVRDLYRLIVSQHVPITQEWMSILMRVATEDRESHDHLLRRVIDIRNHLSISKLKCAELGVDAQTSQAHEEANGTDDIIWEVGVVDNINSKQEGVTPERLSVEPENPSTRGCKQRVLAPKDAELDGHELHSIEQNSSTKKKLLKDAPVIPWGSYLERWGAEHTVPVNQKGLLLESHWGRVDYDALLPAEKVTEMNMRSSYYESTPLEITPCRAPLRNGGFCQRQDLRVCPLHGPVIPRDDQGNPIPKVLDGNPVPNITDDSSLMSQSAVVEESKVCKFNSAKAKEDVLKDVAAKAVANVRSMDNTKSCKKMDRKSQIKRDRQHNATILRDAALAGTSQAFEDILGDGLERFDYQGTGIVQERKRAKAALKAMVDPKPTAKDRLGQRLLSSRVMDASIRQLTQEEDAAYRDAFTNQW